MRNRIRKKLVKKKSFSDFMAETALKDREKRRERRRKRLQNNQE